MENTQENADKLYGKWINIYDDYQPKSYRRKIILVFNGEVVWRKGSGKIEDVFIDANGEYNIDQRENNV